jgi:hypothetical protein
VLDNVGIASLVVNGTSVTPAADGTFSVPVSLAAGANALTATVKDAAGNGAEATETVTYTAPSATTPPPTPAAVKCVVPSVKKGSKAQHGQEAPDQGELQGRQARAEALGQDQEGARARTDQQQEVAATGPAATRRRALRPASVDTVSGTVRA